MCGIGALNPVTLVGMVLVVPPVLAYLALKDVIHKTLHGAEQVQKSVVSTSAGLNFFVESPCVKNDKSRNYDPENDLPYDYSLR